MYTDPHFYDCGLFYTNSPTESMAVDTKSLWPLFPYICNRYNKIIFQTAITIWERKKALCNSSGYKRSNKSGQALYTAKNTIPLCILFILSIGLSFTVFLRIPSALSPWFHSNKYINTTRSSSSIYVKLFENKIQPSPIIFSHLSYFSKNTNLTIETNKHSGAKALRWHV